MKGKQERGAVLLAVTLSLTLIATIALFLNLESGLEMGLADSELEGERAAYAAEAGLAHALHRLQHSNCSGYNDLVATPFGGPSYQAAGAPGYTFTFTPNSGSPVTIDVESTVAGDVVRKLRRQVVAHESPTTLILQPDGAGGKDSYVRNRLNSSNSGDLTELYTDRAPGSSLADHTLIAFDLSTIPGGAIIQSAELSLNAFDVDTAPAGADIKIHPLQVPWTETGVTYQSPDGIATWNWPGNYAATPAASTTLRKGVLGWYNWDITDLAQSWHRGELSNHGLVLLGTSDLYWSAFKSSDDPDPGSRPRLTIIYSCPCGTGCSAPVAGYYRDELPSLSCDPDIAYHGSNGTLDWTPYGWTEIDDDGDPCLSGVRIATDLGDYSLALSGAGKTIQRRVDMTSFSQATFAFDYRRLGFGAATDSLSIAVLTDLGSGPETVILGTITGPIAGDDPDYLPASYDLTPFLASEMTIVFTLNLAAEISQTIYLDNINIDDSPWTPPVSVLLTLNPVADTYLARNNPGTVFGSAAELTYGTQLNEPFRPLLRFDLSSLPAAATVTGATLRLYSLNVSGTKTITVPVHRITLPWDEALASWLNTGGGGYYESPALASTAVDKTTGWKEWNLPVGLIHEWRDGVGTPNYGLILREDPSQGKVNHQAASRENGTAAWHPQLVLDYTLP